ncbi:MAG: hypothetical protein IT266_11685 [Saprospiraceae bacterium]|nr:hypothetical protein [Saprospiraceae bacterium]
MLQTNKCLFVGLVLASFLPTLVAQEDGPENPSQESVSSPVEFAFTGTQLINAQTTKIQPARSWYFEIQHRFGTVGLDSSLVEQFLGFDLPSTIRLALGWSFSDRLYLELGRTNASKTLDLEGKYQFARQTTNWKMPVSMALYANAALRTEDFPSVPPNAYFGDSITPFRYKFGHRLAYNTQLIVSSKLSERWTLQLTPVFIYQNLVPAGNDNLTMVLSAGGRYKLGFSSALIFEYARVFNNRSAGFIDPFSVGVEFGTAGHVFQLFVSNASRILESQIYTTRSADLLDGHFLLGFNIQRTYWRK